MSLWNLTFDDTSPFLTYSPFADVSYSPLTNGWIPWYSGSGFISTNGEGGTGDSFHRTSLDGASVNLEFYGTAVYMYGTTNSSYDTSLDNATYTHAAPDPASGLLLSITGLEAGTHSVALTVRTNDPSQQLAFDRAIVSAPLVNSQIPTEAFYDNTDTTMLAYTGNWVQQTNSGIPNATVTHPYHTTSDGTASVSMNIGPGAAGVSLWGMTNWGNWVYSVFVDDTPNPVSRNGSTYWKVPDSFLFYQGGLDPTKNHTVKLTNSGGLKLSLNSIRVHHIDTTQNPNATASGTTPSSSHSTDNAGVIAGPILGVAALVVLGGFLWWRARRNHLKALKRQAEMTEIEAYTDQSPQGPVSPSKGYPASASVPTSVTAPWSVAGSSSVPISPEYSMATSQVTSAAPVGKMPATSPPAPAPPPPPAPTSAGIEAPDVDRLIELIAQRIDQGRGHTDDVSPPEYRG
ncbi:hypothetical protein C8R43DRAFT_988380 [Mycena crocata]|nr:hypothetical protein C8R43DRAFT_988380 [Mycena crocata]